MQKSRPAEDKHTKKSINISYMRMNHAIQFLKFLLSGFKIGFDTQWSFIICLPFVYATTRIIPCRNLCKPAAKFDDRAPRGFKRHSLLSALAWISGIYAFLVAGYNSDLVVKAASMNPVLVYEKNVYAGVEEPKRFVSSGCDSFTFVNRRVLRLLRLHTPTQNLERVGRNYAGLKEFYDND